MLRHDTERGRSLSLGGGGSIARRAFRIRRPLTKSSGGVLEITEPHYLYHQDPWGSSSGFVAPLCCEASIILRGCHRCTTTSVAPHLPRSLQEIPRRSKIAPRSAQDAPRSRQDAPRSPQDRPRGLPDRSPTPQDRPKKAQERPKSGQEASWDPLGAILGPSWGRK